MTASFITLPGDGEKVITFTNGAGEKGQGIVLLRSDTLDPVTIDANGVKVNLALALPAGTNNIGDVDVVSLPALPAGTNAIGKLAANSGVDIGDVDVISVVPGTAAANLGKAEDSAAGATDTGVKLLAVRDDALSAITPAEGDYAGLRVDSEGKLWVRAIIPDAAGNPQVFSKPAAITVTPTVDTASAYANLDNLASSAMSFAGATVTATSGTGWLTKLVIFDAEGKLGANGVELELWLFSGSVTPPSANAAFSGLSAADRLKRVLKVSTADGTWDTIGTATQCEVGAGIPKPYHVTSGTTLYAMGRLIIPGTAPQWTTSTPIAILAHVIPE